LHHICDSKSGFVFHGTPFLKTVTERWQLITGLCAILRHISVDNICVVHFEYFSDSKIKIYRTIILPVLYGFEAWSLTLREEHRLRVFENRVRRVFGPKTDEVTGMEKIT
jgi:hypothetical protein